MNRDNSLHFGFLLLTKYDTICSQLYLSSMSLMLVELVVVEANEVEKNVVNVLLVMIIGTKDMHKEIGRNHTVDSQCMHKQLLLKRRLIQ